MKQKYIPPAIALSLIAVGIALRIVPHPANFAPIAAIAIFGGSILPRRVAIWVPVGAMIVSDMIIGFYNIMPVIWACYFLIALASSTWLRPARFVRTALLTISSSLFFFIVTNFAVWLWGGMYVHSWSGLVNCYTLALPFFRNTALSDAFYTATFFGIYALATHKLMKPTQLKTTSLSTAN
jgi:hypothetical protein